MNKYIPVCEPYLTGNESKYVAEALTTGWISGSGHFVQKFEEVFANYCGCKYGIAVSNGTAALHLALVALGIGKGDEVIIPDFTMIATAFAVCYTGAVPVFVDAEKNTWNIDIGKIEEKITPRTKAIIAVHLFGLMSDMVNIRKLATKYDLRVIEDAAESHGAELNNSRAGSCSDIGCFSFFANKIITTGEGGMLVTNNEDINERARYFRNMCFPIGKMRNYSHDEVGFNYRMSNLLAAVGLAQTEKIEYYKDLRIKNNSLYRKYLEDIPGIIFQKYPENYLNVCWMNAIVIDPEKFGHNRDELMIFLEDNQIETRLLFNGMHNQKSLSKYGAICDEEFPISDWLGSNGLYLPSSSGLDESSIKHIIELIRKFHYES